MASESGDLHVNKREINTFIIQSSYKNSFFQNANEDIDCTASETVNDDNTTIASTPTSSSSTSGGRTCCVPHCYNNSRRNPELSYYIIPKDVKLRKRWLSMISRKDFKPSSSHRVCSAHFKNGKKTYMDNVPTIVPKTVKLTKTTPRKTLNSSGAIKKIFEKPVKTSEEPKQPTEVELLKKKLEDLTKEYDNLKIELSFKNNELENVVKKSTERVQAETFNIDRFKHNKHHFKFYTGFENYEVFKIVLEYLQPAAKSLNYWGSNTNMKKMVSPDINKRGSKRAMSVEEEFFMTLVRLRCAFPVEDMAVRFNVSSSSVSRIFITWIDFLFTQLRLLPIWASRETVQDTMPFCFKNKYPTTRVILDCTELFIEMPASYRSQSVTFSNYKHHNTAKGLIGIAPNGAVTFVSDLYAGRFSDKQITKDSGIYTLLEKGDTIMADRGFNIDSDLPEGVKLNIPPFLNGQPQLDLNQENETRQIASVRVHVERAIERVKNYKILQSVFCVYGSRFK